MGNEDRSTKNSSASVIEVSPEIPNESEAQADPVEIKVYKKRWFILLQFTLLATGNKFQYLQYTIIQSIVTRYYDVSTLAVQSTVIVFNLSVPIMIYPCTLIMNRWGLRLTMILVSLSTCLGTWIKYIATSPDTFVLAVLGQTLVGAWQGVVISLPGILAARWFGPNEVATATGMGFVGQKVGMAAMSFLVPAVVTTEVFKREPKLPPSKSRALQKLKEIDSDGFWRSLCQLLKNKHYCLLFLAQSLLMGQLTAMSSLLNPLYTTHFKNEEKNAGIVSLIIIVSGLVGAIIFSRILDATKKFKALAVSLYAGFVLSLVAFPICFYIIKVKWTIFIVAGIYGLFGYGYQPISCLILTVLTQVGNKREIAGKDKGKDTSLQTNEKY
ncbi:uncharacterized MFS-type transporter C09D4.1-like [Copidosoma floridanum]|uniref:uncharacterized MFS-type transporter C09D4.1-like n=1 Tax=Copidosoma floridanum TaxID=29053 RepID=UPI0006C9B074|nr:uncharacterized MFS-type transporter C09D4.1-like [Copidosoma floridanum]